MWTVTGGLFVHAADERLTDEERRVIRAIGERLYGPWIDKSGEEAAREIDSQIRRGTAYDAQRMASKIRVRLRRDKALHLGPDWLR